MFKYDFLKRDVPAGAVIFKDGNKIVSHIYDRNIEFIDDDASKVIQMTINLLYENGGGVIFIRKGVYDITTPLYGKSNIQIFGEGFTTILRVSENKTVLALNYLENAVVCNLKIEAPVSSKTYAVTLYESKKCILDKIYLKAGKGIQLEGQNNIIQNSFLEGSGSEFVGEWAIGVGGVGNKILNNEMWGWGHNCIMGSPNRGVIANNYFHDFYDDCIDPNGNYDVVIIGNTCVKGNLDIVGAFVSLEYNCENFVIANNLIRKMPGGVSIRDSKNIVIVGNRFVQPRISSASFVAVEGDSDGILVIGNYAEAKLLTSILFGTKTTLKSKIQILDNILYGTIHPAYIAYIKNAI
ncbi:MAG: right-handed parallel beta-helix repeat-containing protein, partial [Candidatus Methanomethylicia archaeon]